MALKDWHKVSGTKRSYSNNDGRWIWYQQDKGTKLWLVSTMKMGYHELVARTKTKAQALHYLKLYMRTH